jgi:hypothetical protein
VVNITDNQLGKRGMRRNRMIENWKRKEKGTCDIGRETVGQGRMPSEKRGPARRTGRSPEPDSPGKNLVL